LKVIPVTLEDFDRPAPDGTAAADGAADTVPVDTPADAG
jgi:hypothetical protein